MGAEEPEQAEETQLRKLWKTHPSNSSTGTALIDKANQWPLSAGRAQRGPCGQRHLAFSAQLRGMAGGHQLSPVSTSAGWLIFRQSSGSWQRVRTTSTGPKEAQE